MIKLKIMIKMKQIYKKNIHLMKISNIIEKHQNKQNNKTIYLQIVFLDS